MSAEQSPTPLKPTQTWLVKQRRRSQWEVSSHQLRCLPPAVRCLERRRNDYCPPRCPCRHRQCWGSGSAMNAGHCHCWHTRCWTLGEEGMLGLCRSLVHFPHRLAVTNATRRDSSETLADAEWLNKWRLVCMMCKTTSESYECTPSAFTYNQHWFYNRQFALTTEKCHSQLYSS